MNDKLSLAALKAIRPGEELKDHEVRGLSLRAFPTKKAWYLRYTTQDTKQRRHPKLGEWPSLSIEGARTAARSILSEVAAGGDPAGEWKAKRAETNVNDLCDRYIAEWSENPDRPKAEKSAHEDVKLIDAYIRTSIGRTRIRDVGYAHIEQLLSDVLNRRFPSQQIKMYRNKTTSPFQHNRVRALLHKMFALAETRFNLRDQNTNPVKGQNRKYEAKRRRYATSAELPRIANALKAYAADYPLHVAGIWTLFFSGARVNEIQAARANEWKADRIVKREHKTSQHIGDKTIFLPMQAREILMLQPVHASGLLFGGVDFATVFEKVRNAAGCPDLQLRDLRRTFASIALTSGKTLEQIGELFGHTDTQTTKGYAYLLEDAKRTAVQETADAMTARMGL